MNDAGPDDRELRDRVRAALEREDAARSAPPFAATIAAARRRNAAGDAGATRARGARPAFAYAAVAAAIAVVALTLTLVRPPQETRDAAQAPSSVAGPSPEAYADADYVAAVALRQRVRGGTPLDPLLASLPRTVARGLPAMPEYRYPLLPEDAPLGADSTTRNPS